MKRSLNHRLFETFLKNVKHEALFEETRNITLGSIIAYCKIHNQIPDDYTPIDIINLNRVARGFDKVEVLEHADNSDLNHLEEMEELLFILSDEDVRVLKETFEKIEEYHKNRKK